MNHDTGGIIDPHAGRYNGTDHAVAQAIRELQYNFQRLRPDGLVVIAGPASQPGHYYALELQGQTTSDGTATIPADYGLQRRDNVIVVINTFEQATGTHWIDAGTTVNGTRRINAGSNQAGVDTIFVSVPYNYAGTNLAGGGGTSGGTNTGGFGDPIGDGSDDGSGTGSDDGIPDYGGGGGDGSGFGPTGGGGGGGGGGGDDGSCPMTKTVTIAGTNGSQGVPDGTYTFTWDAVGHVWSDLDDGEMTLSGSPSSWHISTNTLSPCWEASGTSTCPVDGVYTSTESDGSTATVS